VITGAASGYGGWGLYRSDDAGENWFQMASSTVQQQAFGGFGWYFGLLEVAPNNPDDVWLGGVELYRTTDGGATLLDVTGAAHVDHHALWVDPLDASRVYLGNDGGFYWLLGSQWQKALNLPITQVYDGTGAPLNVNQVLGGAQDNGTNKTEPGADGGGEILGGDGFQCLVDPPGSSTILSEWQFCSEGNGIRRSVNNGASYSATGGWVKTDRFNWNTPFVSSPRSAATLIAGSQRVYKSTNGGLSWTPVSGDLTNGPGAQVNYNTITTVAISAADSTLYLAGTDDGRVWRSQNSGVVWQGVRARLPARYRTRVAGDPHAP